MGRTYVGIRLGNPGVVLFLDRTGVLDTRVLRWDGLEDFIVKINEAKIFDDFNNLVIIEIPTRSKQLLLFRGALETFAVTGVAPYYYFTTNELITKFEVPNKPLQVNKIFRESWPDFLHKLNFYESRLALVLEAVRCRTFQPKVLSTVFQES